MRMLSTVRSRLENLCSGDGFEKTAHSLIAFMFVFMCLFTWTPSNAQVGLGDDSVFPDLGDTQSKYNSYNMDVLGDDLVGDHIDIDTGGLSLTQTDVSIPGNSALPVSFGRMRSRSSRGVWLGDWSTTIPYISRNYLPDYGPNLDRCTGQLYPSGVEGIVPSEGYVVDPESYFNGYNLSIPGRNPGTLAQALNGAGNLNSPEFTGTSARMTSKNNWIVTCGVTASDGGEGFIATAPNGDKYTFGFRQSYFERQITYPSRNENKPFPTTLPNYYNSSVEHASHEEVLYVTKIEDVHGNWVDYEYANDRPSRIISNDGREITFGYSGANISTVTAKGASTANDRIWQYQYNNEVLTQVTEPDNRIWTISANTSAFSRQLDGLCALHNNTTDINDVTITHPSGTTAKFEFTVILNGRTNMQVNAADPDTPHPSAQACFVGDFGAGGGSSYQGNVISQTGFYSFAVIKKTLTVPGAGTYVWTRDYEQDYGSYSSGVAPMGGLNLSDTKKRTITDPLGNKTVMYVNRNFSPFEGSLMKTEIIPAGSNTPIQTVNNTYILGNIIGGELAGRDHGGITNLSKTTRIYQTQSVTTRDGDTFTDERIFETDPASSSFAYNQPHTVRRSSNVSTTPRETVTTYEHKKQNWILGLPKTVTQNGRQLVSYDYDALGQKTAQSRYTQADFAKFFYNSDGTLDYYEDALNRKTKAENWKRGKPQKVTKAYGSTLYQTTTELTVNNHGWVTNFKDAKLRDTAYTHDKMGRLTQIDPPDAWSNTDITYTFPSAGGAVQTITKGDAETTVTYDGMFRPVLGKTSDTATGWESYVNNSYDGLGRNIFTSFLSDSASETNGTTTLYDGLGRAIETKINGQIVSTTDYQSGHKRVVTNAKGDATTYTENGYGEPISILQPLGILTEMTRNEFGQMTELRQSGTSGGYNVDHAQQFYYDAQQRLCRHHVPESGSKLYLYDAAGQVEYHATGMPNGTSCGIPSGNESTAVTRYTDLGQVRALRYPNSSMTADFTYQYDANGNMTFMQRSKGAVAYARNYYGYNALDLPTTGRTQIYANADDGTPERNFLTDRQYTANGHLKALMYPSGEWARFNPDALGRSAQVEADGVGILASNVAYHPNGAVDAFTYGTNSGFFLQTLDARQRPSRVTHRRGGVDVLDLSNLYDANSRITTQTDHLTANRSRSFTYDAVGRLTQAAANDNLHGTIDYAYDALGNLRRKDYTGGQYDGRNIELKYTPKNTLQFSHDKDASGNYAYTSKRWTKEDAHGNIVHMGPANVGGFYPDGVQGLLHLVHDMTNRPVHVYGKGLGSNGSDRVSISATHLYDGHNRRVKTVQTDGTVRYNIFDAAGTLLQVHDATTGTSTDYISGPHGALARIKRTGGSDVVSFIHADHLGTARAGTDAAGTVLWEDFHTPYGESLIHPDATDDQGDFTGHIRDKQSGLTYMQARYYDPVIGRFLSVDPVGFVDTGDPRYFNRYAYTANDPINGHDPNGEATISVNVKLEGRIGSIVKSVAERVMKEQVHHGGVQGKLGIAVSFPAFDGAKFDAGIFAGFGATDVKMDPDAQSLHSLPGAKAGIEAGISQGSVGDISGRETAIGIQGNIGKKVSSTIVDGVSKLVPKGPARDFLQGPVKKTSGALLGLVASAGVTHDDQGNFGVEGGLAKGLNLGVSADVTENRVCSFREGCQ